MSMGPAQIVCEGRNHHDLRVILRHGGEMEETVVRWCAGCGGVVVDTEVWNSYAKRAAQKAGA